MSVDKCLTKLKINKYISRYEFLTNEYKETMYLFEGYKRLFNTDCAKQVDHDSPNSDAVNAETCTSSIINGTVKDGLNAPPLQTLIDECGDAGAGAAGIGGGVDSDSGIGVGADAGTSAGVDDVLAKLIKKLYRRLILITHPDKHGLSSHSHSQETEFFHSIQDAYKTNDLVKLLWIAYKHNIDIDADLECCNVYEYMSELDGEIHKCIDSLTKNIDDIKNTLAWNWAFADDNQKTFYRNQYNL